MKVLKNKMPIDVNFSFPQNKIGNFLTELKKDETKNHKKIVELCHTGKFLLFFDYLTIDTLSEKPDFILKSDIKKIGLEHQIIVKDEFKEKEGFIQNIFSIAEKEMQAEKELSNYLVNCHINPYAKYQLSNKKNLISTIKNVIKQYVLTREVIKNPIIDQIFLSPHSQLNIAPNFGAWWIHLITSDIIKHAVNIKNEKIKNYNKDVEENWLLLVIASLNASSYDMDENMSIELNTKFDKVFILEDFKNILYQLK